MSFEITVVISELKKAFPEENFKYRSQGSDHNGVGTHGYVITGSTFTLITDMYSCSEIHLHCNLWNSSELITQEFITKLKEVLSKWFIRLTFRQRTPQNRVPEEFPFFKCLSSIRSIYGDCFVHNYECIMNGDN